MYGLCVSPFRVVGNKKSQKIVAVVTITTPVRLIQLLDRWMNGDSQPRSLLWGFDGVIGCRSVSRGPCRDMRRGVLFLLYTFACQKGRIQRIHVGIENNGVK